MALTIADVRGVIPAIATPLTANGGVDGDGVGQLVEHAIAGGVHGIMVTGGTGEFVHLSRGERLLVTQEAVAAAAGRAPVYAGTAAASTEETIALTQDAAKAGAAAAIVVAPYYFSLPQDALARHYTDIAARGGLPLVVYNNPLYTGNNLTPATLASLATTEGIVGLKQSNADLGQLVETVRRAGDHFAVLTGIDSQFYPALCTGARGIFSTAACVIPREIVAIYDAFGTGDHEQARTLHLKVQVLNRFLEYDPGYVAPCKEALALLGLPGGPVRRPLPDLTDEERAGIRAALEELGLL